MFYPRQMEKSWDQEFFDIPLPQYKQENYLGHQRGPHTVFCVTLNPARENWATLGCILNHKLDQF